jgi:CubicO group peptidase (beta-lactamase class C family)
MNNLFLLLAIIFSIPNHVSVPENAPAPGDQYDFSALENHLQKYIDEEKIPCASVLILKNNNAVFQSFLGYQNIKDKTPVQPNTIFRLASLTKPITSIALLTLVDKGTINLEDKLSDYLPEFKNLKVYGKNEAAGPITIRQMLAHYSGMSSGLEPDEVGVLYRQHYQLEFDNLKDFAISFSTLPLTEQPGTKFIYSHSPDVLAYLIEKVSGQPYMDYLKKNVLEPLEMNNTVYTISDKQLPNFATLYKLDMDGQLVSLEENQTSEYVTGENFPKGNRGLASTIGDYANFCVMLLNDGNFKGQQILKKETVKAFRTNQIAEDQIPITIAGAALPGTGFGLGVSVSINPNPLGQSIGSYGWIGGSHTQFFIDPKNNIVGLLFSQQANAQQSMLMMEFNPLVYKILGI